MEVRRDVDDDDDGDDRKREKKEKETERETNSWIRQMNYVSPCIIFQSIFSMH